MTVEDVHNEARWDRYDNAPLLRMDAKWERPDRGDIEERRWRRDDE